MNNNYQLFNDDYLYIVRVYEDDETYEYQYGNEHHAREHYDLEKSKGNKASLLRCNICSCDDALECLES